MDAPLITLDPGGEHDGRLRICAEWNGAKSLVTALGVYPHEEPGVGPNKYNFDDNVLYEIHVATGNDVAAGRATLSYEFEFETTFKNQNTILQSYLGVVNNVRTPRKTWCRPTPSPRSTIAKATSHSSRHGRGPAQ